MLGRNRPTATVPARAARSSRGGGLHARRRVLTAHNPRAGRRGGTVTEGPMVVAGGKVLSASSRGPLGGNRARRELAGLNEVVAR
jgi:hypothetical protein